MAMLFCHLNFFSSLVNALAHTGAPCNNRGRTSSLRFYALLLYTILRMKASSIIMYWCSTQVKTSDTMCLYMKVVDPRCIDFVICVDNKSNMARECRI